MPRQRWSGPGHRPLTDKQRRFVEEYVVDMNATQAAQRAGYAYGSSSAVNVIRLPQVVAAVEAALAAKRERSAVDADRLLEELAAIAFANVLDYGRVGADGRFGFDLAGLSRGDGAAIKRVRVEYFPDSGDGGPPRVRRVTLHLADKVAALRMIARHLGLDREAGSGAEGEEPEARLGAGFRGRPSWAG